MSTYKLAAALGGGTLESVDTSHETEVGFLFAGVDETVYLPRKLLTLVKPPLPPEPPPGSVVQTEAGSVFRRGRDSYPGARSWVGVGGVGHYTWAELCGETWVAPRLMVAQGPKELPRLPFYLDAAHARKIRVDRRGYEVGVEIHVFGDSSRALRAPMTTEGAAQLILALTAAINQIELATAVDALEGNAS